MSPNTAGIVGWEVNMGIADRIILILTGLVAIYLILRLVQSLRGGGGRPQIYYLVGFAVLLAAGLLLAIFGYDALGLQWVVIVAVLIPGGVSLGLIAEYLPRYEKAWAAFMVLGLIAISITRYAGPPTLATVVLVIVHASAGLVVFGLPVWAVAKQGARAGFLGVTVGGALIGIGGIALAALKTGSQVLFFSADVVFLILAPLLLVMTLAYTWGFMKQLRRA